MDRLLKATEGQLSSFCVIQDMLYLDHHLCIVMEQCGMAPFLSVKVMHFLFKVQISV